MRIRAAEADEAGAICELLEDAFGRPDEARLFRELSGGDELAVALVATGTDGSEEDVIQGGTEGDDHPDGEDGADGDGAIRGVAVLSRLTKPKGCLALGPLAVDREHSNRGIGKALIAESIDRAGRDGADAVFVLGQPPYYERFGFSVEAARPFASPYPAEFMMALELRPGALAEALAEAGTGRGELRYPPAFATLG